MNSFHVLHFKLRSIVAAKLNGAVAHSFEAPDPSESAGMCQNVVTGGGPAGRVEPGFHADVEDRLHHFRVDDDRVPAFRNTFAAVVDWFEFEFPSLAVGYLAVGAGVMEGEVSVASRAISATSSSETPRKAAIAGNCLGLGITPAFQVLKVC